MISIGKSWSRPSGPKCWASWSSKSRRARRFERRSAETGNTIGLETLQRCKWIRFKIKPKVTSKNELLLLWILRWRRVRCWQTWHGVVTAFQRAHDAFPYATKNWQTIIWILAFHFWVWNLSWQVVLLVFGGKKRRKNLSTGKLVAYPTTVGLRLNFQGVGWGLGTCYFFNCFEIA